MFKIIFMFFTLSFQLYGSTACKHSAQEFNCVKFIKNYDADTITVDIPNVHELLGKNAKIRVAHIDTPEVRTKDLCEKKLAKKAKEFVYSVLSKSKRIDLKNVKKGKYFRIVAEVFADGKNLSEILLKEGLAYHYEGGKSQKGIGVRHVEI